ncbi:MAG: hypothetical protein ACOYK9_05275 [Chlamydiia bacterium]
MTLPHLKESSKELLILSNLGFVTQSNHIDHLIEAFKKNIDNSSPKKISILVETSAIKSYLKEKLTNYAGIDFTEPAQFDPFLRYRIDKELAEVFHLYAKFGDTALDEWLDSPSPERDLYKEHVRRGVPLRAEEIHLFHPTYLPKWYLDPLLHRNAKIKLFVYILSPSPLFLFDLVKEKHLQQDPLAGAYIEDQYRLLANLVPYKLPLLKAAEHFALKMDDAFVEPVGHTSLSVLKRNLYFQQTAPIEPDASLCVIEAATVLEEAENCFAFIYELLKNHPDMGPSDITILADLKIYGPLLELTFEDKIALQIDQVPIFRFDPSIKKFFRLFSLFDSLWTLAELKALFIEEPLDSWLEAAGFSFGYDAFLVTFENLMDRMVNEPIEGVPHFPISLASPLIGLADTLKALHQEIYSLKKLEAPLEIWLERLKDFFCRYLEVFDDHPFFSELLNYQPLMSEELKDFNFIRQLLFDLFESLKGPILLNNGDRVRASNIKEGAILPNRVLFVLGMGLKKFPGSRPLSSLYQLKKSPPAQGVIDRYKFLEILLNANERLIFSFSESAPSTLIEEIFRPL